MPQYFNIDFLPLDISVYILESNISHLTQNIELSIAESQNKILYSEPPCFHVTKLLQMVLSNMFVYMHKVKMFSYPVFRNINISNILSL